MEPSRYRVGLVKREPVDLDEAPRVRREHFLRLVAEVRPDLSDASLRQSKVIQEVEREEMRAGRLPPRVYMKRRELRETGSFADFLRVEQRLV